MDRIRIVKIALRLFRRSGPFEEHGESSAILPNDLDLEMVPKGPGQTVPVTIA
jgi:hypothetical protein